MKSIVLLAAGFLIGQTPAELPPLPSPATPEKNMPVSAETPFFSPLPSVSSEAGGMDEPKDAPGGRLPYVWTKPDAGAKAAAAAPEPWTLPDRVFSHCWFEELYDWKQRRNEFYHMPIMVGAWHWAHVNNDGPLRSGYGIPTLQGTYYWYILADPVFWKNEIGGFVKSVGGHVDWRARENDQFRSFFDHGIWTWEAYGYVDTEIGKFKAGQIWKRFGLDWDGSFWGNAPYFDGFKLDPDWGLSWENTWNCHDRFKLDSFVQYFFHEDGINGSIEGAGPDSIPGSHERHFGVARVVPTWTFHNDHTVALGLSGMVGEIDNDANVLNGRSVTNSAWAVDATYQYKNLKLYAEYLQSFGVRSPANYVSGGPSDRIDNLLVGAHYKVGPATLRFTYSAGWYDNPSGFQELFVPGVMVAMTKNIDFYCEYVRWNTQNQNSEFALFEDGFQFVINWRY